MENQKRPGRNGGTLKTGGNNGGGRPRKIPELKELIDNVMGEIGSDGKSTAMQAIVMRLRNDAIKGDKQAAKLLLEYAYGKPTQKIEVDGEISVGQNTYKLPDGTEINL